MSDELQQSALGRLEFLAMGGQGRVYRVPELVLPDAPPALVYKEYKAGQVSPHGLRAIVAVRSRLAQHERERLDSMAAWPARLVKKGDDVCGVVMPEIPSSFFQTRTLPSGTTSSDAREIQYLFIDPKKAQRIGMPKLSLEERFAVCRDLAGALAFLHAHGVVFGDVNAKNALFRTGTNPRVMLVDCDAVRIRGSAAVVKQLNAPDWEPPEGRVLSQATDLYKLGLFVLRTVAPGDFASTARDPRRADPVLDAEGRLLLAESLRTEPNVRPTAAAWRDYFARRIARHHGKTVVPANPVPQQGATKGWRRDGSGKWVPAV